MYSKVSSSGSKKLTLAGKNPKYKGPKNNRQIIMQIRKDLHDVHNMKAKYDRVENIIRSFLSTQGMGRYVRRKGLKEFYMWMLGTFIVKKKDK